MAIQTKFKLTESIEIDSYVRIFNIVTYKTPEGLKLIYDVEYLTESNGMRLKLENYLINYNSGDIWNEAYSDLKLKFDEYLDV